MTIQDKLKEILERAEKAATARSDDFGHDCQALLVWESDQLDIIAGTDVPALTKALAVAVEALELSERAYSLSGERMAHQDHALKSLKEISQILGEK